MACARRVCEVLASFWQSDLDLVEGLEGGHLVFEQPLVVGVFPARVLRVVGIADQVVLDAVADFHDVFLQLRRAAREILVDHRLAQRVGDRDDHRGVLAGRVFGLVVFGLEVAALPVEFDQGQFPGAGDAVSLYVQNRYAFHECVMCCRSASRRGRYGRASCGRRARVASRRHFGN